MRSLRLRRLSLIVPLNASLVTFPQYRASIVTLLLPRDISMCTWIKNTIITDFPSSCVNVINRTVAATTILRTSHIRLSRTASSIPARAANIPPSSKNISTQTLKLNIRANTIAMMNSREVSHSLPVPKLTSA